MSLSGKRVLLGVTGSIAGYKAAELVRALTCAGADVRVIMTENAEQFVGPLTFRTLTGHPVATSEFEPEVEGRIFHISLIQESDVFLVAPATANILAKAARGVADDLLSTSLVTATCPIIFVPAMNPRMYLNEQTQANVADLRSRGMTVMAPGEGVLACGEEGIGRIPSTDEIVAELQRQVARSAELSGKRVVVTAGATREYIDPVRFITNRSSGKMGYAVAEALRARGADVVLISAAALPKPYGVEVAPVSTGEDMEKAVLGAFDTADAVVMASAVCDFRPAKYEKDKIKRRGRKIDLTFVEAPDILAELGKLRGKQQGKQQGRQLGKQVLVGFAAETKDLLANAKTKLKEKNLDMVFANDVTAADAGFEVDTNKGFLVDRSGGVTDIPTASKREVAEIIVDHLAALMEQHAK